MVCEGPLHVAVFAPPQFELPMHGRTSYVPPQEQSRPSALSSTTGAGPPDPHPLPTLQLRPSHESELTAVPVRNPWHRVLAVAPVHATPTASNEPLMVTLV
jgi:hypothetical protein